MRQRLADGARRGGLAERTLAQHYVEEGLRHDAHPLIGFLDGPSGQASLVGRGLDVWEVIATIRDNGGSIAEAAEYLRVRAAWWRLPRPTTASSGTTSTRRSHSTRQSTSVAARQL